MQFVACADAHRDLLFIGRERMKEAIPTTKTTTEKLMRWPMKEMERAIVICMRDLRGDDDRCAK